MTDTTLEILNDGIASAYWEWFAAHVEEEWGRGGKRFHEAVQKAASKEEADGHKYLQMVIFAQAEIQRLMMAPKEELNKRQQLKREALNRQMVTSSRRGPGL